MPWQCGTGGSQLPSEWHVTTTDDVSTSVIVCPSSQDTFATVPTFASDVFAVWGDRQSVTQATPSECSENKTTQIIMMKLLSDACSHSSSWLGMGVGVGVMWECWGFAAVVSDDQVGRFNQTPGQWGWGKGGNWFGWTGRDTVKCNNLCQCWDFIGRGGGWFLVLGKSPP